MLVICIAPSCFSESFESFFSDYSGNVDFALERTVFPLESSTFEFGLDEKYQDASEEVITLVDREYFSTRPPLASILENYGLVTELSIISESSAKARVYKNNTDFLLIYRYKLIDGKWYLVKVENHSL